MLEEVRLVKTSGKYTEREDGGFGWRGKYEVLWRKCEQSSQNGSVCSWKEKIRMRNEKEWVEEISSKSILK